MTAGLAGYAGVWRSALVAAALAFSGGNIAFAHGTHEICLSGYEVSPGLDVGGGLTKGVTFAGIDNRPDEDGGPNPAACDLWTKNGNGGSWTAKIDRVGVAGIGGYVTVVGGRWFWLDGDDRLHFGRVQGGFVQWPSGPEDTSLGCGESVAKFSITLSVRGQSSLGSFVGCLDDTHLNVVFPPHIWGTLKLN